MFYFFVCILFLIFIFIFIFFKKIISSNIDSNSNEKIDDEINYQAISFLLTKAERSFYGVLCEALKNDYDIFSKVRVADVMRPASGINKSQWQKLFNKVSRKHFDFVICDKNSIKVLCAVELDDSSHNSKSRKKRDDFLVLACKSASVPFLQVVCKHSYNVEDLRLKLLTKMELNKISSTL
ncbi:MAG: hypothetical protein COB45_14075 [Gammaproteobacteria bacterium]|nr:MAG: hypothetical protein COB45_14075 [Gammaproteobacteria bacterium]